MSGRQGELQDGWGKKLRKPIGKKLRKQPIGMRCHYHAHCDYYYWVTELVYTVLNTKKQFT